MGERMSNKEILELLCSKNCVNKRFLETSPNWVLHLALCCNCKYSRKLNHYCSEKEWKIAEAQIEQGKFKYKTKVKFEKIKNKIKTFWDKIKIKIKNLFEKIKKLFKKKRKN